MGAPFSNPVAEAVPFDGSDQVPPFVAGNTKDAIIEARETAFGIKARFAAISAFKGIATSRFLQFFKGISSNAVPFILAEDASIKALSIAVRFDTTATVTLFVNGGGVEIITITAAKQATKKNLNIVLSEGDRLSARVTLGTMRDPVFSTFIQVDV